MSFLSICVASLVALSAPAGVDSFTIGLEEVVSDGVPGPGAGNIEVPGAVDEYEFTLGAETEVYFDEISGSCSLRWSVEDSSGATVFANDVFCSTDPGTMTLAADTYTITCFGFNDATGTYSFTLWEVNMPDMFAISTESPVSDGVPGVGAGNIEEAGAMDIYTFTANAGDELYFDELSGGCNLRWNCEAPDGSVLFNNSVFCSTDPGAHTAPLTGTYTITASGTGSATGTYSFTIWDVNPADEFAIAYEDVIEDGIPGAGAGNIEEAGTIDIYTFDGLAGEVIYFDELDGSCSLRWMCEAPDGSTLFNNSVFCSTDPGEIELPLDGEYTIVASGNQSATGTYSFTLLQVATADEFTIGYEEVVSDGVPDVGAGNIEEPGSVDVYTFTGAIGDEIYFDELDGGCGIGWSCETPSGAVLFNDLAICSIDPGAFVLDEDGDYTITVVGSGGATGTYSFTIWDVNPTDVFTISLDEVIADGAQGAGSGNIEEPGTRDEYHLDLVAGDLVCFEELAGSVCGLRWACATPSDATLFDDSGLCITNPGRFEAGETGTYVITVRGNDDATGTYTLIVNTGRIADLSGDCTVSTDDLLIMLGAWGTPDADISGDGNTDVTDLLLLLGDWG